MARDEISASQRSTGDMDPEEFRAAAKDVADRVANYLRDLEKYSVLPPIEPGDVRRALPEAAPDAAEPLESILDDYHRLIEPNITHWQHPGFMAYFPSIASGPGILGEWLATSLNSNVMFWRNAPASTELEQVVVDWMRGMTGLPEGWDGMFTDTASVSSLLSLVAARHRVEGLDSREKGLAGRPEIGPLRIYISDQAHMSIDKAAIVTGIGRNGIRRIPVDEGYRMRPDALQAAIAEDRAAGDTPVCVVATLGTTSTTSVDPIAEIATVCERENVWLHVDAAYAGSAAVLPEMRHHFAGWERADSIIVNPHKWFFTPFDASLLFFRDPDAYRRAFSLTPDYIDTRGPDELRNYNEYGIQLGRRFRALKLWVLIRWFGVEGIRARLREHCSWAGQFAGWVDEAGDWERLAAVPFATVCFRHRPPGVTDEAELGKHNQRIVDTVNASGRFYLSTTKLSGRFTIRLALGNPRASLDHVRAVWELLRSAAG
jgi:aromatic-L-amino-acid decarboxylase